MFSNLTAGFTCCNIPGCFLCCTNNIFPYFLFKAAFVTPEHCCLVDVAGCSISCSTTSKSVLPIIAEWETMLPGKLSTFLVVLLMSYLLLVMLLVQFAVTLLLVAAAECSSVQGLLLHVNTATS